MTHDEWSRSEDGPALLREAALRIPVPHLCLVLSEISARCFQCSPAEFRSGLTPDWRAVWGLVALRGWCCGHVTRMEAIDARNEAVESYRALRSRAAHVVSLSLKLLTVFDVRQHTQWAQEVGRVAVSGGIFTSSRLAHLVRQLVPFPAVPSKRWHVEGRVAFSGDAMLRLDGWVLVDAIACSRVGELSADRAVAFDEGQCVNDGLALPDTSPLTGCVMTVDENGSKRISCYGPSEPSPPRRPPPPRRAPPPVWVPPPAPPPPARSSPPPFELAVAGAAPAAPASPEEIVLLGPPKTARRPVAKPNPPPRAAAAKPPATRWPSWRLVFFMLLGAAWFALGMWSVDQLTWRVFALLVVLSLGLLASDGARAREGSAVNELFTTLVGLIALSALFTFGMVAVSTFVVDGALRLGRYQRADRLVASPAKLPHLAHAPPRSEGRSSALPPRPIAPWMERPLALVRVAPLAAFLAWLLRLFVLDWYERRGTGGLSG